MGVDPHPMSELQPTTPSALERLVQVCQSKDPEDRPQTARDLGRELRWVGDESELVAATSSRSQRLTGVIALAALAVAVTILVVIFTRSDGALPVEVTRFSIGLEADQFLAVHLGEIPFAVTPDDSHVAYVSNDGSTTRLFVRRMDEFEAQLIPGTEGAGDPFFSPDGEWLGFFANGQLLKVSLAGGAPQVVSPAALRPIGASWGSDGNIVFGDGVARGLSRVSEDGGTPVPLTTPRADEFTHHWPDVLPGGEGILFTFGQDTREIAVFSFATGDWKPLNLRASGPTQYVSTGHIVYSDSDTLWAVPFDVTKLELTGSPEPIEENLYEATFGVVNYAPFAISSTGSLVYPSNVERTGLVWLSRETGLVDEDRSRGLPFGLYVRLSPLGDQLSVSRDGRIWIYGGDTAGPGRPLTSRVLNIISAWTPDGDRLAFASPGRGEGELLNLHWQPADGSGDSETLLERPNRQYPADWADSETLIFYEVHPENFGDILTLRLNETTSVVPFLVTGFDERTPRLSPDGRWLAYASNQSGQYNVYVRRFPEGDLETPISSGIGDEPVWSRDGSELYYRQGNRTVAVPIESGETLTVGTPQVLFEGLYSRTPCCGTPYDVSPDGQYFLMLPEYSPRQINVVRHWSEEVAERVPAP